MSKITELRNVTVGVQPFNDGAQLTIEDKHTREVLWINMPRATCEELAGALTSIASGIVLPGKTIFQR